MKGRDCRFRAGIWMTLLAAINSAGACSDQFVFEGSTWQSTRVRYHARSRDPLACPGVVPILERRADLLSRILQRSASLWEPYDYYKTFDDRDYQDVRVAGHLCASLPTQACQQNGDIFSPQPVDDHELGHLAYSGIMGEGPRFLEEGFAIGLTCASSHPTGVLNDASLESALDPDGPQGPGPAARVATALWFAGTPEQFYELEAALGILGPTTSVLAGLFARIYGKDLNELWTIARSKQGLECVASLSCDAPLLELGETALGETCTGQGSRRLSDAVAPALGIRVAGPSLFARACDGGARPDPIRRISIGVPEWPWRYEYWIRAPSTPYALIPGGPNARLGFETFMDARDIGQAFAPKCDATKPIEFPRDQAVRILLPYEAGTYYFPMELGSARALAIAWVVSKQGSDFPRVLWCSGCSQDTATSCVEIDAIAGVEILTSTTAVLRVVVESDLSVHRVLELAPAGAKTTLSRASP